MGARLAWDAIVVDGGLHVPKKVYRLLYFVAVARRSEIVVCRRALYAIEERYNKTLLITLLLTSLGKLVRSQPTSGRRSASPRRGMAHKSVCQIPPVAASPARMGPN